MKLRLEHLLRVLCIAGCVGMLSCDGGSGLLSAGSDGAAGASDPAPASGVAPGGAATSVGDVTIEVAQRAIEPGEPFLALGTIAARVHNDSPHRVDMTLRFILEEEIVHLAFLQVRPETVTTVVSPEAADELRMTGVDERGEALPSVAFHLGEDFDENTPAIYRVSMTGDAADDPTAPQPAPDPGADPVEPAPQPYVPPTISLVEPAQDATLPLGSTLLVRWTDSSSESGTVVVVGMQPVGGTDADELVQLGPAVSEAFDGINDELFVVLQGLHEGLYEVVAEIDDGVTRIKAVAAGQIQVIEDEGNQAPTLSIVSPVELVELPNGNHLRIAWEDVDADDNAVVTFSLVPTEGMAGGGAEYSISPPFAEDPDSTNADSATLLIEDVLPGLYDLVGLIDDGELRGTARSEAAVRILADAENDVPQITMLMPAQDMQVEAGAALQVRWSDSDENDNAIISLLLDPDLSGLALDGDEILLIAALGEDVDGPGDQVSLGVPLEMAPGSYRVVGVIADGLSQAVAFAPGTVQVVSPIPEQVSVPRVVFLEPSGDAFIRLGHPLFVRLYGEHFDSGIKPCFFLDNTEFGGDLRVELPPLDMDKIPSPYDSMVTVSTKGAAIPNDAWPRSFVFEVEVTVDGQILRDAAAGLVWIRQEIEVIDAQFLNVDCPPTVQFIGDMEPPILSITWYGGGFQDTGLAPRSLVDFWLTMDQLIPKDGIEDSTHVLVFQASESPNEVRTDVVELLTYRTLENGTYQIITVVQDPLFGEITVPLASGFMPAYIPDLQLCFPQQLPGGG